MIIYIIFYRQTSNFYILSNLILLTSNLFNHTLKNTWKTEILYLICKFLNIFESLSCRNIYKKKIIMKILYKLLIKYWKNLSSIEYLLSDQMHNEIWRWKIPEHCLWLQKDKRRKLCLGWCKIHQISKSHQVYWEASKLLLSKTWSVESIL